MSSIPGKFAFSFFLMVVSATTYVATLISGQSLRVARVQQVDVAKEGELRQVAAGVGCDYSDRHECKLDNDGRDCYVCANGKYSMETQEAAVTQPPVTQPPVTQPPADTDASRCLANSKTCGTHFSSLPFPRTYSCGDCANGLICSNGQCVAQPCNGRQCGLGTDLTTSCGTCQTNFTCGATYVCEYNPPPVVTSAPAEGCTPQCSGKSCGSDGCGGYCGSCRDGYNCNTAGQCYRPSDQETQNTVECTSDIRTYAGCENSQQKWFVTRCVASKYVPATTEYVNDRECDTAPTSIPTPTSIITQNIASDIARPDSTWWRRGSCLSGETQEGVSTFNGIYNICRPIAFSVPYLEKDCIYENVYACKAQPLCTDACVRCGDGKYKCSVQETGIVSNSSKISYKDAVSRLDRQAGAQDIISGVANSHWYFPYESLDDCRESCVDGQSRSGNCTPGELGSPNEGRYGCDLTSPPPLNYTTLLNIHCEPKKEDTKGLTQEQVNAKMATCIQDLMKSDVAKLSSSADCGICQQAGKTCIAESQKDSWEPKLKCIENSEIAKYVNKPANMNTNCGGLDQGCCGNIGRMMESDVYNADPNGTTCADGLVCDTGRHKCIADVEFAQAQSVIHSLAGRSISPDEVSALISSSISKQSQQYLSGALQAACPGCAASGGACVHNGLRLVCIDAKEIEQRYAAQYGSLDKDGKPKVGDLGGPCDNAGGLSGLGQALYGKDNEWGCSRKGLTCTSGTCQLTDAAKRWYAGNIQADPAAASLNTSLMSDKSTSAIMSDPSSTASFCKTSDTYFFANGSCYACVDAKIKSYIKADDRKCFGLGGGDPTDTIPGARCRAAGGYCAPPERQGGIDISALQNGFLKQMEIPGGDCLGFCVKDQYQKNGSDCNLGDTSSTANDNQITYLLKVTSGKGKTCLGDKGELTGLRCFSGKCVSEETVLLSTSATNKTKDSPVFKIPIVGNVLGGVTTLLDPDTDRGAYVRATEAEKRLTVLNKSLSDPTVTADQKYQALINFTSQMDSRAKKEFMDMQCKKGNLKDYRIEGYSCEGLALMTGALGFASAWNNGDNASNSGIDAAFRGADCNAKWATGKMSAGDFTGCHSAAAIRPAIDVALVVGDAFTLGGAGKLLGAGVKATEKIVLKEAAAELAERGFAAVAKEKGVAFAVRGSGELAVAQGTRLANGTLRATYRVGEVIDNAGLFLGAGAGCVDAGLLNTDANGQLFQNGADIQSGLSGCASGAATGFSLKWAMGFGGKALAKGGNVVNNFIANRNPEVRVANHNAQVVADLFKTTNNSKITDSGAGKLASPIKPDIDSLYATAQGKGYVANLETFKAQFDQHRVASLVAEVNPEFRSDSPLRTQDVVVGRGESVAEAVERTARDQTAKDIKSGRIKPEDADSRISEHIAAIKADASAANLARGLGYEGDEATVVAAAIRDASNKAAEARAAGSTAPKYTVEQAKTDIAAAVKENLGVFYSDPSKTGNAGAADSVQQRQASYIADQVVRGISGETEAFGNRSVAGKVWDKIAGIDRKAFSAPELGADLFSKAPEPVPAKNTNTAVVPVKPATQDTAVAPKTPDPVRLSDITEGTAEFKANIRTSLAPLVADLRAKGVDVQPQDFVVHPVTGKVEYAPVTRASGESTIVKPEAASKALQTLTETGVVPKDFQILSKVQESLPPLDQVPKELVGQAEYARQLALKAANGEGGSDVVIEAQRATEQFTQMIGAFKAELTSQGEGRRAAIVALVEQSPPGTVHRLVLDTPNGPRTYEGTIEQSGSGLKITTSSEVIHVPADILNTRDIRVDPAVEVAVGRGAQDSVKPGEAERIPCVASSGLTFVSAQAELADTGLILVKAGRDCLTGATVNAITENINTPRAPVTFSVIRGDSLDERPVQIKPNPEGVAQTLNPGESLVVNDPTRAKAGMTARELDTQRSFKITNSAGDQVEIFGNSDGLRVLDADGHPITSTTEKYARSDLQGAHIIVGDAQFRVELDGSDINLRPLDAEGKAELVAKVESASSVAIRPEVASAAKIAELQSEVDNLNKRRQELNAQKDRYNESLRNPNTNANKRELLRANIADTNVSLGEVSKAITAAEQQLANEQGKAKPAADTQAKTPDTVNKAAEAQAKPADADAKKIADAAEAKRVAEAADKAKAEQARADAEKARTDAQAKADAAKAEQARAAEAQAQAKAAAELKAKQVASEPVGSVPIGRGANGITDGGMSRQHAELVRLADGSVAIRGLDSENGTYVNGNRIISGDLVRIAPGDTVEMGNTTYKVQANGALRPENGPGYTIQAPDARIAAEAKPKGIIEQANALVESLFGRGTKETEVPPPMIRLDTPPRQAITIGRRADSDVVVPTSENYVSRDHFNIVPRADGSYDVEVKGAAGATINGKSYKAGEVARGITSDAKLIVRGNNSQVEFIVRHDTDGLVTVARSTDPERPLVQAQHPELAPCAFASSGLNLVGASAVSTDLQQVSATSHCGKSTASVATQGDYRNSGYHGQDSVDSGKTGILLRGSAHTELGGFLISADGHGETDYSTGKGTASAYATAKIPGLFESEYSALKQKNPNARPEKQVELAKQALASAIAKLNADIKSQGFTDGTTLTFAVRVGDTVVGAQLGDSRLYVVGQDGKAKLVSPKHEWENNHPLKVQGYVYGILVSRSLGDNDVISGMRSQLADAQSRGDKALVKRIQSDIDNYTRPDIFTVPVKPGDKLIAGSDSLEKLADILGSEEQVRAHIEAAAKKADPSKYLVDVMNQYGIRDDRSASHYEVGGSTARPAAQGSPQAVSGTGGSYSARRNSADQAEATVFIGRDSSSIQNGDEGISRRHAVLARNADGSLTITDSGSSNGTFINGIKADVGIPVKIKTDDTVKMGNTTYTVQADGSLHAPASVVGGVQLSASTIPAPVKAQPVAQANTVPIGRASAGNRDRLMSNNHATLSRNPDGSVSITDQNSTNGTIVNGIAIKPQVPYRLSTGDKILIGNTKYTVLADGSLHAPATSQLEASTIPAPATAKPVAQAPAKPAAPQQAQQPVKQAPAPAIQVGRLTPQVGEGGKVVPNIQTLKVNGENWTIIRYQDGSVGVARPGKPTQNFSQEKLSMGELSVDTTLRDLSIRLRQNSDGTVSVVRVAERPGLLAYILPPQNITLGKVPVAQAPSSSVAQSNVVAKAAVAIAGGRRSQADASSPVAPARPAAQSSVKSATQSIPYRALDGTEYAFELRPDGSVWISKGNIEWKVIEADKLKQNGFPWIVTGTKETIIFKESNGQVTMTSEVPRTGLPSIFSPYKREAVGTLARVDSPQPVVNARGGSAQPAAQVPPQAPAAAKPVAQAAAAKPSHVTRTVDGVKQGIESIFSPQKGAAGSSANSKPQYTLGARIAALVSGMSGQIDKVYADPSVTKPLGSIKHIDSTDRNFLRVEYSDGSIMSMKNDQGKQSVTTELKGASLAAHTVDFSTLPAPLPKPQGSYISVILFPDGNKQYFYADNSSLELTSGNLWISRLQGSSIDALGDKAKPDFGSATVHPSGNIREMVVVNLYGRNTTVFKYSDGSEVQVGSSFAQITLKSGSLVDARENLKVVIPEIERLESITIKIDKDGKVVDVTKPNDAITIIGLKLTDAQKTQLAGLVGKPTYDTGPAKPVDTSVAVAPQTVLKPVTVDTEIAPGLKLIAKDTEGAAAIYNLTETILEIDRTTSDPDTIVFTDVAFPGAQRSAKSYPPGEYIVKDNSTGTEVARFTVHPDGTMSTYSSATPAGDAPAARTPETNASAPKAANPAPSSKVKFGEFVAEDIKPKVVDLAAKNPNHLPDGKITGVFENGKEVVYEDGTKVVFDDKSQWTHTEYPSSKRPPNVPDPLASRHLSDPASLLSDHRNEVTHSVFADGTRTTTILIDGQTTDRIDISYDSQGNHVRTESIGQLASKSLKSDTQTHALFTQAGEPVRVVVREDSTTTEYKDGSYIQRKPDGSYTITLAGSSAKSMWDEVGVTEGGKINRAIKITSDGTVSGINNGDLKLSDSQRSSVLAKAGINQPQAAPASQANAPVQSIGAGAPKPSFVSRAADTIKRGLDWVLLPRKNSTSVVAEVPAPKALTPQEGIDSLGHLKPKGDIDGTYKVPSSGNTLVTYKDGSSVRLDADMKPIRVMLSGESLDAFYEQQIKLRADQSNAGTLGGQRLLERERVASVDIDLTAKSAQVYPKTVNGTMSKLPDPITLVDGDLPQNTPSPAKAIIATRPTADAIKSSLTIAAEKARDRVTAFIDPRSDTGIVAQVREGIDQARAEQDHAATTKKLTDASAKVTVAQEAAKATTATLKTKDAEIVAEMTRPFQEKLTKVTAEKAANDAKLAKANARIAELDQKVKDGKTLNPIERIDLAIQQKIGTDMEGKIKKNDADIKALQDSINAYKALNTRLAEARDAHVKALDAAAVKKAKSDVEQIRTDMAALREKDLKAKDVTKSRKLDSLTDDLKAPEKSLDKTMEELHKPATGLIAKQKGIETDLKTKTDGLVQAQEAKIQELKDKQAAKEAEIASKRMKIAEVNAGLEKLKENANIRDITQHVLAQNKANGATKILRAEIAKLEKENITIKGKIDEAESRLNTLRPPEPKPAAPAAPAAAVSAKPAAPVAPAAAAPAKPAATIPQYTTEARDSAQRSGLIDQIDKIYADSTVAKPVGEIIGINTNTAGDYNIVYSDGSQVFVRGSGKVISVSFEGASLNSLGQPDFSRSTIKPTGNIVQVVLDQKGRSTLRYDDESSAYFDSDGTIYITLRGKSLEAHRAQLSSIVGDLDKHTTFGIQLDQKGVIGVNTDIAISIDDAQTTKLTALVGLPTYDPGLVKPGSTSSTNTPAKPAATIPQYTTEARNSAQKLGLIDQIDSIYADSTVAKPEGEITSITRDEYDDTIIYSDGSQVIVRKPFGVIGVTFEGASLNSLKPPDFNTTTIKPTGKIVQVALNGNGDTTLVYDDKSTAYFGSDGTKYITLRGKSLEAHRAQLSGIVSDPNKLTVFRVMIDPKGNIEVSTDIVVDSTDFVTSSISVVSISDAQKRQLATLVGTPTYDPGPVKPGSTSSANPPAKPAAPAAPVAPAVPAAPAPAPVVKKPLVPDIKIDSKTTLDERTTINIKNTTDGSEKTLRLRKEPNGKWSLIDNNGVIDPMASSKTLAEMQQILISPPNGLKVTIESLPRPVRSDSVAAETVLKELGLTKVAGGYENQTRKPIKVGDVDVEAGKTVSEAQIAGNEITTPPKPNQTPPVFVLVKDAEGNLVAHKKIDAAVLVKKENIINGHFVDADGVEHQGQYYISDVGKNGETTLTDLQTGQKYTVPTEVLKNHLDAGRKVPDGQDMPLGTAHVVGKDESGTGRVTEHKDKLLDATKKLPKPATPVAPFVAKPPATAQAQPVAPATVVNNAPAAAANSTAPATQPATQPAAQPPASGSTAATNPPAAGGAAQAAVAQPAAAAPAAAQAVATPRRQVRISKAVGTVAKLGVIATIGYAFRDQIGAAAVQVACILTGCQPAIDPTPTPAVSAPVTVTATPNPAASAPVKVPDTGSAVAPPAAADAVVPAPAAPATQAPLAPVDRPAAPAAPVVPAAPVTGSPAAAAAPRVVVTAAPAPSGVPTQPPPRLDPALTAPRVLTDFPVTTSSSCLSVVSSSQCAYRGDAPPWPNQWLYCNTDGSWSAQSAASKSGAGFTDKATCEGRTVISTVVAPLLGSHPAPITGPGFDTGYSGCNGSFAIGTCVWRSYSDSDPRWSNQFIQCTRSGHWFAASSDSTPGGGWRTESACSSPAGTAARVTPTPTIKAGAAAPQAPAKPAGAAPAATVPGAVVPATNPNIPANLSLFQSPLLIYGGTGSNWSQTPPMSGISPVFASGYVAPNKDVNVGGTELIAALAKTTGKPILFGHSYGANAVMIAAHQKRNDGVIGAVILADPDFASGDASADSVGGLSRISEKLPVLLLLSSGHSVPERTVSARLLLTVLSFETLDHAQLPLNSSVQAQIVEWTKNASTVTAPAAAAPAPAAPSTGGGSSSFASITVPSTLPTKNTSTSLLLIGDSNTENANFGVSKAALTGFSEHKMAGGGWSTKTIQTALSGNIPDARYAFILAGTGDSRSNSEATCDGYDGRLQSIIDQLQSKKIIPIVQTIVDYRSDGGGPDVNCINTKIRSVARGDKEGVVLVDTESFMKREYMTQDGFHYNTPTYGKDWCAAGASGCNPGPDASLVFSSTPTTGQGIRNLILHDVISQLEARP